jgi:LacI family transcriptional regulator
MGKRPTITDLARAAGLSVATVDRVLNGRAAVRDETAARVAAAAEVIGYHAAGLLKQRATETPARTFGFVLQKRDDAFYQGLAAALSQATRAATNIRGKPVVAFTEELVPGAIARKLLEVGASVDALAVVAVDHPHVTEAIEALAAKNVPTFALLSDVSAPSRAGFIGLDSRKLGRIAGWTISRLAREPGPVGVLVGTHRYLGHELAEMSFRSYFREHASGFRLLETVVDLEDDRIAYEATLDLLGRNAGLKGIYLAGGGMKGMIEALRDERGGQNPVVVCNELLPVTRAALLDGVIELVLSTPLPALAARTVEALTRAVAGGPGTGLAEVLLPADLYISENL